MTHEANETRGGLERLGDGLWRVGMLFKRGPFSNFGEERILKNLIAELLPPDDPHVAVDIGAGDGVKSSNTYALFLEGWRGLGIEGDPRKARRLARAYKRLPGVKAMRARVTPESVAELLESHGVEKGFSLLSLDIDGYDFWVLDAVLKSLRPRLVVTEINEKIPPPIKFTVGYDPDFRLTHHFFGYSIASLEELCQERGYALVGLEYNNAFLAAREFAGARRLSAEEAYRSGYLERADRRELFPQNENMEILHGLEPEKGVEFLKSFYAAHEGKYRIGISDARFS